jgi:tRNA-dihydrouridine synthase
MLGRAIFGNPWLFAGKTTEEVPLAERLSVLVEQCYLFETYMPRKSFAVMKKHFKSYTAGAHGAAALREQLVACNSAEEVATLVAGF